MAVSDLVVLWVHTTSKDIKQVNMLRQASVEILLSLAAGYEGTEDDKLQYVFLSCPTADRQVDHRRSDPGST